MHFNKILFPFLIFASLSLNYCKNDKKEITNIKEKAKEMVIKPSETLEKRVSSNSPEISLETIRNNEYLLKNIQNRRSIQNEEYLIKKINQFAESLEHTYVKTDTDNTVFYKVSELTLNQLQRIYLLYEYLGDSSSRQEIGKIIEEDVLDMYAEHGGIIVFNKGKIHFKTFKSSAERDTSNNDLYGTPDEASLISNIGYFHLHATSTNEKESADPSNRDITTSYFTIYVNNEAHDFLITPINRGTFNVDYYGGHKEENPVAKVIDLGNYNYDTTKIEQY